MRTLSGVTRLMGHAVGGLAAVLQKVADTLANDSISNVEETINYKKFTDLESLDAARSLAAREQKVAKRVPAKLSARPKNVRQRTPEL